MFAVNTLAIFTANIALGEMCWPSPQPLHKNRHQSKGNNNKYLLTVYVNALMLFSRFYVIPIREVQTTKAKESNLPNQEVYAD